MSSMKWFILVFVALAIAVPLAINNPLKITDPNDPRFNPDTFSFSDYSGRDETLRLALKKTFPVGTPLEYVEKIMKRNADVKEGANGYVAHFYDMGLKRIHHIFIFDKNYQLLNIIPYTPSKILYEHQPDVPVIFDWNDKEKDI